MFGGTSKDESRSQTTPADRWARTCSSTRSERFRRGRGIEAIKHDRTDRSTLRTDVQHGRIQQAPKVTTGGRPTEQGGGYDDPLGRDRRGRDTSLSRFLQPRVVGRKTRRIRPSVTVGT